MSELLPLPAPALLCPLLPSSAPHTSASCRERLHPSQPRLLLFRRAPARRGTANLPPTPLPAPKEEGRSRLSFPRPLSPVPAVSSRVRRQPRRGGLLKDTHMEERLSCGDVPRQPKLQSSRSGSARGEGGRERAAGPSGAAGAGGARCPPRPARPR